MISFRVSADDSPILAKQFEPQFEPNDLLQMHNRNFVINMVINGEKAPAFSARTLNLPPAQTDNTKLIIENTRAIYSQPREAIEQSINDRILPPENLTVKRPGPAYTPPKSPEQREADRIAKEQAMLAQGKQWPIDGITPDAANTPLLEQEEPVPVEPEMLPEPVKAFGSEPSEQPTKKKRSRTRKRKSGDGEGERKPNKPRIIKESNAPSNAQPPRDDTLLKLR